MRQRYYIGAEALEMLFERHDDGSPELDRIVADMSDAPVVPASTVVYRDDNGTMILEWEDGL